MTVHVIAGLVGAATAGVAFALAEDTLKRWHARAGVRIRNRQARAAAVAARREQLAGEVTSC